MNGADSLYNRMVKPPTEVPVEAPTIMVEGSLVDFGNYTNLGAAASMFWGTMSDMVGNSQRIVQNVFDNELTIQRRKQARKEELDTIKESMEQSKDEIDRMLEERMAPFEEMLRGMQGTTWQGIPTPYPDNFFYDSDSDIPYFLRPDYLRSGGD